MTTARQLWKYLSELAGDAVYDGYRLGVGDRHGIGAGPNKRSILLVKPAVFSYSITLPDEAHTVQGSKTSDPGPGDVSDAAPEGHKQRSG